MNPQPQLIKVGTVIINPAFVAYAARSGGGYVSVHMGVGAPERIMRGTMTEPRASGPDVVPAHPVLSFSGAEAEEVWAALVRAARGVD